MVKSYRRCICDGKRASKWNELKVQYSKIIPHETTLSWLHPIQPIANWHKYYRKQFDG